MTEAQFLDQLEAWALGALTPEEREAMEAFLTAHPTPRWIEARARAFETAALLGASLPPSRPPAEAWDRLRAELTKRPRGSVAEGAGAASAAAGASRRTERPDRARAWAIAGWVVAAAAVLALVWSLRDRDELAAREAGVASALRTAEAARDERALAAVAAEQTGAACRRDLEALRERDALAAEAVALLELPGTQLIPLERRAEAVTKDAAVKDAAANAIYHRGVKRAYVVVAGLPAGAGGTGDAYQVWVLRGGQRVAAGTIEPDASGRAVASVPRPTLDPGVPEKFQVTRKDGTVLLESSMRI